MITDLGVEGLRSTLDLAAAVKADPRDFADRLQGKRVGLFFEKPSTRTRVSSEVATVDLGAHPIVLKDEEVGLGKRESVEDVARVLDRYLDVIAMRVFDHRHLDTIATYAAAPVINLLSDRSHPCQALADLQTIEEHRPLAGTIVTYVGDGNNVCHSLMLGGAMAGVHVRVVTAEGHEPDEAITAQAAGIAQEHGGSIATGHDVAEFVEGADVVYTDVWASMGQESDAARRSELFRPLQVDGALFSKATQDAIFLHCLPAHRGEEVTDDVMEHARSRVFDQAENRLHAFKALLLYLLGP